MSTQATPVVTSSPTLEEKILYAATEAEKVVALFQPTAAAAIAAGVQVEPMIKGLVGMFAAIFKHHATVAPSGQ